MDIEFQETRSAAEINRDMDELLNKLPLFVVTSKGEKLTEEQLRDLIAKIETLQRWSKDDKTQNTNDVSD